MRTKIKKKSGAQMSTHAATRMSNKVLFSKDGNFIALTTNMAAVKNDL